MPDTQEKIMKSLTIAALLLAATNTFALAQSPTDHETHHPAESAAPAPAQPQTQQGMGPSQGMMGGGQGMMSGRDDMMGGGGMMNMMGGNMPMMNMMQMMGMGGMMGQSGGMATIDHVEGRIAFLRTELKVTEAQTSAWNAFADALRANAKSLGEVRASMMPQAGAAPQTMVDRLALQEKWLAARLEGTRAIKSALANLVSTFSDEQKKTADELLAPHMGMMAMMSGMQSGQMGPGRMVPGQMMPGR